MHNSHHVMYMYMYMSSSCKTDLENDNHQKASIVWYLQQACYDIKTAAAAESFEDALLSNCGLCQQIYIFA